MSYAERRQDPRKHMVGLFAVVAFHAVLAYALANGLARKVVDVLKAPLSVNVIEEIKTLPPPPPPKVVPQPPKVTSAPPPPAYVPPVEVPVQAPPTPAPVITTSNTPTPPAPPAPPAPAPVPAAPPAVNVAVACPNFRSVQPQMPPQAERMGLSGDVVVEFVVAASGEVKNIAVARSTNSIFNAAATKAVSQYRCNGQGHDVRVKQQISFRVEN